MTRRAPDSPRRKDHVGVRPEQGPVCQRCVLDSGASKCPEACRGVDEPWS